MWTLCIVIPPPSLDFFLGILQREKPALVQAFGAEPGIECFDERVVGRLPESAEVESYRVQVRPLVKDLRSEFAAIVYGDGLRPPSLERESAQSLHDPMSADAQVHDYRRTLTSKVIDYRSEPDPASVDQFVAHEIQGPTLVLASGHGTDLSPLTRDMAPPRLFRSHGEALCFVEPIDSFVVHVPSLPFQENMQPLVAVTDSNSRKLAQAHPQGSLLIGNAPIPARGPGRDEDPAGPSFADLVTHLEILGALSLVSRR